MVDILVRRTATFAAVGRLLASLDQHAAATSLKVVGVSDVKLGRSPAST